jgi:hypothetical protein
MLPTTSTRYLPQESAAYHEYLASSTRICYLHLPPRFRDLFEDMPESKDALGNGFKVH